VANSRALHALADGSDRLWPEAAENNVHSDVGYCELSGPVMLTLSLVGREPGHTSDNSGLRLECRLQPRPPRAAHPDLQSIQIWNELLDGFNDSR
jgi:hypothetical protein